jgi:putative FmdB family regulatory protein
MPTYEYRCRDCGHTFDIVQSMKDDALTVCPECGGSLRKVFGAPMISFKGSGFYATDHGKKSKSVERTSEQKDAKQGAESGSTSSSEDKGGGDKKSADAAPAAKSEPSSGSKTETKSEPKTPSKKESS